MPFLPALGGAFLYDDVSFRSPELVAHPWRAAARGILASRWIPNLLTGLDAAVWGPDRPAGFHATNLLLHAAAAVAALALARRLLPPGAALLGAIVFAVHPLQSAAACYVVQRAEILAGLFGILSVHFWVRSRERPAWWFASVLALVLALLSKDNAAAVPALILATELLLRRAGSRSLPLSPSPPWGRTLAGLSALLLVTTLYLCFNVFGGGPPPGTALAALPLGPDIVMPPGLYATTEVGVLPRYLRLLALPFGQRLDYDWGFDASPLAPRPFLGAAVLLSLVLACARNRLALWALAWFLLALAPTSSLLPIADPVMEHRPYTALLGPALLAGALGPRLVAPIACLAVLAFGRAGMWGAPHLLWRESARHSPYKSRPWVGWGEAERDRGRKDLAWRPLSRGFALDPKNALAAQSLGHLKLDAGDWTGAEPFLRRSLASNPSYPETALDLSVCLWRLGRDAEALPILQASIAAQGDMRYARLHDNLGKALIRLGRPQEALEPLQAAVAIVEDAARFQRNLPERHPRLALAEALGRCGRFSEARGTVEPLLQGAGKDAREAWAMYRKASQAMGDAEGAKRAEEGLGRTR